MQDLKAKKSLGQNFLNDDNILNKIANSIDTENDLIIEIGPGMGALTKKLIKKNSYLIAYEIDERTKPFLLHLENEKTRIIYNDFLKTNLKEDIKNITYNRLYIIANIPYYITTPIIEHIIESEIPVESMVLLVQKEVADRFSAKPKSKDYGSLTVYLNTYFKVDKLFDVKNTCFNPVPKVDSAVVKFTKKNNEYNIDSVKFSKFIKECFSMKRKTLKNNLKKYDFTIIKEILLENGYNESARAEELDLDTFIKIYMKIVK
ncbi:MAG: ribosomal RNA small subunit methyltransferase A [Firmicutes bacterium]|nr:ribosomal RNA small subunit methyltransferase A [Bacillota bacterium]